jgi:hypothetical protein
MKERIGRIFRKLKRKTISVFEKITTIRQARYATKLRENQTSFSTAGYKNYMAFGRNFAEKFIPRSVSNKNHRFNVSFSVNGKSATGYESLRNFA